MGTRLPWLWCLLAVPFSASTFAQSIPAQQLITQPIIESQVITLKGNTHPLAQPRFDIGPAPTNLPLPRMYWCSSAARSRTLPSPSFLTISRTRLPRATTSGSLRMNLEFGSARAIRTFSSLPAGWPHTDSRSTVCRMDDQWSNSQVSKRRLSRPSTPKSISTR